MVESDTKPQAHVVRVDCEERLYAPFDAFHSTPDEMRWRRVTITTPNGSAALEQSDYGHPGRLNPWEARGITASLQSRLGELRAVAEAVSALL